MKETTSTASFPTTPPARRADHRIRVLQSSGVGVAGELGQHHAGHQGVVDGEESQPLSVGRPPVSQVGAQDLL